MDNAGHDALASQKSSQARNMPSEAPKQAACLNCRKSKIRCSRPPDGNICRRCEHLGAHCKIPEFHIGRQRGVKNKRTGLEKAIFQIQEAIKKSDVESKTSQNQGAIEELRNLLDKAQATIPACKINPAGTSPPQDHLSGDEQLALDDAENPLQLLARASDLRLATPQTFESASHLNCSTPSVPGPESERVDKSDISRFFLPMKASYDTGPEHDTDSDPIELGLVTLEEAATLSTL